MPVARAPDHRDCWDLEVSVGIGTPCSALGELIMVM